MTTTSSETTSLHTTDLGRLVLLSWIRPSNGGDVPYLLLCAVGDDEDGTNPSTATVEHLLRDAGLAVGGDSVDATRRPDLPISLLVVPGSAVLTLPHIKAPFIPPEGWLAAAEKQGVACLVCTTRPWLGGDPGDYEALAAFANDQATLEASARIILPARGLRS
ncbi:DUF5949 family protein [Streptomyces minutiscleroticus]|uniref:DUF5949 family protein n=1 Tax=Streptomyces minutiscleroticus TaxID=68238 RepID=UPI00167DE296|nr:DUF5949 family protein [Streptomyces minutiscleroticus]